MRRTFLIAAVLLGLGLLVGLVGPSLSSEEESAVRAAQETEEEQTPAYRAEVRHRAAPRGPEQPIPFNHAFHVTDLGIQCEYCHTGTDRGDVGVIPPMSTCMGCHAPGRAGTGLESIEELREYDARGEAVPWKQVYRLPEFVRFSHRAHLRSGVECAECHGPVEEMDRVWKYTDLSMGWCLECHRSEPEEEDVATDYLLVKEFPPADIPEGRQVTGLYPRRIDTEYAAWRGPIDCAVCHY